MLVVTATLLPYGDKDAEPRLLGKMIIENQTLDRDSGVATYAVSVGNGENAAQPPYVIMTKPDRKHMVVNFPRKGSSIWDLIAEAAEGVATRRTCKSKPQR